MKLADSLISAKKMKAAIYHKFGSPDVINIEEIDEPKPRDKDIIVRVHASSVNPADWKIRQGKFPVSLWRKFPKITGWDVAGEVIDRGSKASKFHPGDKIYACMEKLPGGACAEYVRIAESAAAKMPEKLSFEEAAAIPLAALTALQALRNFGKIEESMKVLINGAAGGVGSFAVQIANAFAADITAVTSEKNIDFVRGLGADRVINYQEEDFTKLPGTYDIIFDTVALKSLRECKNIMSPTGIYITTLPTSKMAGDLLTSAFSARNYQIIDMKARGEDLDFLRGFIEQGRIKPQIEKIYALEDIREAHRTSEKGRVRGKLVIKIT